MTAKQRFASNLRFLRCRSRLTMRELAIPLGVTQRRYRHWENGRATPNYDVLVRIAEYYDVGIDNLLKVNLDQ